MNKIDFKISLLLALVCFVAGFFILPYQLEVLETTLPEQYAEIIEMLPFPMGIMLILTAFQFFVISFILSFVGIKLARKTGFSLNILDSMIGKEKVVIDKKATLLSIVIGMILGLIIIGADRFYFQYEIPMMGQNTPQFSLLGLITGVLYGGVFEEIAVRLFFMSLLIWLFAKVLKCNTEEISSKFYWLAIFISLVLFAVLHLPATEMFFGEVTPMLLTRGLLLNGIGGLFFGYLYWKKGFEYAILSHMVAHISMQLIFIPVFYS
ncbi:MAG: CPBP family intramembrane metalloprotease [Clostridiaceae bacterium]|nr:CPBP family intramembrane metalloprotease [Clostridiaceae bacterium]